MTPAMRAFAELHKFPFMLSWPNGEVANEFVFAASTSADRAAWANALMDAISRLQIGAPTANILLHQMPALRGVYVVRARLDTGEWRDGVANIGLRPTVDGKRPSLEVHLFDFAGTLYGQHLEVVFRHGLRDEVKFDSVDELRQQIARDFEHARAWLAENPATPET